MSQAPQRLADYLAHIVQAAQRIARYTEDMDETAFVGNSLVQDAVLRNIEIMGEAARNIESRYPQFAAEHGEIAWREIYLMRNRVSHGYFTIDLEIIWRTVQRDIPEVYREAAHLLQKLGHTP